MAITLLSVSIVIFVVIELPPGDFAERYAHEKLALAGQQVTETDIQNYRVQFGLDRPFIERYVNWIAGIVLRGDFGTSFMFQVPVSQVISNRVGYTALIAVVTLVLTYGIATMIGIYSALNRHTLGDYLSTVMGYAGLALPNFLLALILLYISVNVLGTSVGGLFSPEYANAPWSLGKVVDLLKHLWVPAVVLGTANTAFQIQTIRATMLDEMNEPYVVAARARGIPEWKLNLKYPVRMAMSPIVSTIGFELATIVSGAPIVAYVLAIPDAGQLLITSLLDQDMYLAGALLLFISVLIVIGTLVSDLILAALDPRIRRGLR
jgi:peptide/nickel transport system permease protein